MKKIITILALSLVAVGANVSAREKNTSPWKPGDQKCAKCCDECECRLTVPKTSYINLSSSNVNLKVGDAATRSSAGAAFEVGKTYFFNARKPVVIPNVAEVRFGLDASWLDLQYNEWDLVNKDKMRYAHIGMQVGPSVTVTPLRDVNVRLYCHYNPSFALLTLSDDIDKGGMYGYAGYVAGGLHASWKFLTLGVELRGATAKLNHVSKDNFMPETEVPETIEELGDFDPNDVVWQYKKAEKLSTKLPGVRFTLGFRF